MTLLLAIDEILEDWKSLLPALFVVLYLLGHVSSALKKGRDSAARPGSPPPLKPSSPPPPPRGTPQTPREDPRPRVEREGLQPYGNPQPSQNYIAHTPAEPLFVPEAQAPYALGGRPAARPYPPQAPFQIPAPGTPVARPRQQRRTAVPPARPAAPAVEVVATVADPSRRPAELLPVDAGRRRSEAADRLRRALHDRQSLRQAILLQEVLGPPLALRSDQPDP